MMKIKYTTIAVTSMEESIKFYRDILGLTVDRQFKPMPGLTITFMKGEGESIIELIESEETRKSPGMIAVGLEVKDMNATIKDLKSKGAKIIQEPTPISNGILAFVEDPNGVHVAILQH